MKREFQVARIPHGDAPNVQAMKYTDAQTFKKGAPLVAVAAGTVQEGGADPTGIIGIALQGAGTGPGYDAANSPTVVTGREQEVSVALADRSTVFSGRMENGGAVVTPLLTHIDTQYGIAKDADGSWYIDETETTNVCVEIVDIDLVQNVHLFKFLEADLALP